VGFGRAQGNQLGLRRRKIDRFPAIGSRRFDDLPGAGEMSDGAPQPAPSRLATVLFGAAKRLGTSALPFVVVILLWQFASLFFPRFLFPSLIDVFWRCLEIFSTGSMFADVLATVFRILAGLAGAFIVGGALALLMVRSGAVDRFLSPILSLFQGIPALSWVVFAIIWFHGVEFRIFFIMVMTTLPAFTFQVLGALRGMSKDLMEMVFSFRPTRLKLFRVMIAPAILPDILTAWKVNLGNASRVVVVAELVGATGGVGYELLQQQQMFDMAGALAWTLQLVFFVLIFQGILTLIEKTAFRYRAVSERAI
jgi:ABC-type nitrate/sulfonate/bicarbonate transport system permease component